MASDRRIAALARHLTLKDPAEACLEGNATSAQVPKPDPAQLYTFLVSKATRGGHACAARGRGNPAFSHLFSKSAEICAVRGGGPAGCGRRGRWAGAAQAAARRRRCFSP